MHYWQKYKHLATIEALRRPSNTLFPCLLTKTTTGEISLWVFDKNFNLVVILRECAPAFAYVCIWGETSGGGEDYDREERVCYCSLLYGKIMKTAGFISAAWLRGDILSPHLNLSCQKRVIRTLLPDLHSAENINTITASKLKAGFGIVMYSWSKSTLTVKWKD